MARILTFVAGSGGAQAAAGAVRPWQEVSLEELTRSCEEGTGHQTDDKLCFFNHSLIIDALSQANVDAASSIFQHDLHELVKSYMRIPPAWAALPKLLDPQLPWSRGYCDFAGKSNQWNIFEFFEAPMGRTRNTLEEMQRMKPQAAALYVRWFRELRTQKDAELHRLLDALEAEGLLAAKTVTRLLQHLHAKALRYFLGKCCRGFQSVMIKLASSRDEIGRTLLHALAGDGNTATARLVIQAVPVAMRASFLAVQDKGGYTAEDWARLRHHEDMVTQIRDLSNSMSVVPNQQGPADFFPARQGNAARSGDKLCCVSKDGCGTRPSGMNLQEVCQGSDSGWNEALSSAVPSQWLPPPDKPCFADVIDVRQFNWSAFLLHYFFLRPLLIRGGARVPQTIAAHYTRQGLLAVAGNSTVHALPTPYSDMTMQHKPIVRSLKEHVAFLEGLARTDRTNASSYRQYVFERVQQNGSMLNFSWVPPEILDGKAQPTTAQFYLGGALMGSAVHHHGAAANSLLHGKKLWLVSAPGEAVWSNEAIYDYLVRTEGAPEMMRCVQEAGDLFFVPHSWSHGAVCLSDCIGVAHEFTPLPGEFSKLERTGSRHFSRVEKELQQGGTKS